MLEDILKEKRCFKLVCGAGNENIEEVRNLVALYSAAGCNFFDLSANCDVVAAAKEGIKISGIEKDRYLCVSVGLKGDPHLNKAYINKKCISCGQCENKCLEHAILNNKVEDKKCIGCGRCLSVCPIDAIEMRSCEKNLSEILPPIIDLGIDCIEFHAISPDDCEIDKKWKEINRLYKGMLSICIDRSNLSNKALFDRLNKMLEIRKPYTTIIQADGSPMSGGCDNYKTTLQAVATAEIVQNQNFNTFLLLSGGTNSKTAELARLCEIDYNGISIGSFARKIVKEYIERDDFLENKEVFNSSLEIAKQLVENCLK